MSWIEVESKLKVQDVKDARRRIKEVAKFVKIENKVDEYFSLETVRYPKKSLRVRNKGKNREVNFKKWVSYENGIHSKREVEFKVSDLKGFYDLINDFGFKKWMKKEKRTELYRTKDGVNIELNYVKRLGWFIELEYLAKPNEITRAQKKIDKLRTKLGFIKKDVEKKGYTKSLWELKKK